MPNNEVVVTFRGQDAGLNQSLSGAQAGLKGVAEGAKQAGDAAADAGKKINSIAELSKTLGTNFVETKKFAESLGLSTAEANKLVQKMLELKGAGVGAIDAFKQINAESGISIGQFRAVNQALKQSQEAFAQTQQAAGSAAKVIGEYDARVDQAKKNANKGSFIGNLASQAGEAAFKFNNILQSLQAIGVAGQKAYDVLIGSNERLNQQILSSQTNLASTTRIFEGGVEIKDPTAQINASRSLLESSIKQIERDTESLVGVTSSQVNELFQITLTNAAELNKQSKEFPDPIRAATSLTKGWAASLQVMNVPLFQARQEINSILKGQIDQNSIVAKNLGITNEQVRTWKAQGTLVDELNKRLGTFTAGNAIAARSVAGIYSNIQDVLERLGRSAGQPLLEPVIDALDVIYKFLKQNEEAFTTFFGDLIKNGLRSGEVIFQNLAPAFQQILTAVATAAPLVSQLLDLTGRGLANVTAAIGPVIEQLARFVNFALEGYGLLFKIINFQANKDAEEAFKILSENVDELSDKAIKTASSLKSLSDAEAKNGKLTAEQAALRKRLNAEGKNELADLDAKIAAFKELTAAQQDAPGAQAQLKSLQAVRDALAARIDGPTFSGQGVKDLGTAYDQLAKKAKDAQTVIKDEGGGDTTRLNQSFKDLIATTEKQIELGTISEQEAQRRLSGVAGNAKAEQEIQLSAQQAIAKIRKAALDQQVADIGNQIAQVEVLQSTGKLTEIQAAEQVTELKKKQLDLQLSDVEEAITREESAIAKGTGSKTALKKLQGDRQKLLVEQEKATIEGEQRIQAARIKVIEDAANKANAAAKLAETQRNIETQKLINAGVLTEAEANQSRLKSTQERLQAEFAAEQAKLTALKALPDPTNPEARKKAQQAILAQQQKVADLTLQQLQNQQAQEEALRQVVIKRLQEQQALQKVASDAAVLGIEKQVNALDRQRVALEQQKTAQDFITKSLERQSKLLQSNSSVAKAQADARVSQSNGELSAIEKAIKLRSDYDKEQDPTKKQGIAQALALLGVNAQADELALVQQKQELENRIAEQKRAAILAEQERAKASLNLDIQREASAARQQVFAAKQQVLLSQRAELEAKITKAKADQAVLDARSQLAIAQQEKDPEKRKVAVAQAEQAISQAQQQGTLADQQAVDARQQLTNAQQQQKDAEQGVIDQQKIADNSRQLLTVQQASELSTFNQAENLRQVDQILESSAARADQMAKSLQAAADASGNIGGTAKPLPARKDGGNVSPGQPFIGGELGPELVTYSDGSMGLLPTPGIYQVPDFGVVSTAAQTNRALAASTARASGNDRLLGEIKGLRQDLQGIGRPQMDNTYVLNDVQDPIAKIIRLQQELMRAKYG